MSRITLLLLLTIFLSLFMFSVATIVHAAGTTANEVVSLDNPLGEGIVDLRVVLGKMVNKVLGVLGAVALLVFVVGGAMWLTSGGNAEKVKNGTMAMMWAVIGLFIIFSSYAILNLVIKGLFAADATAPESACPAPLICMEKQREPFCACMKEKNDKYACAWEKCNNVVSPCPAEKPEDEIDYFKCLVDEGTEQSCELKVCPP